jgi:hypothetical protein
VIAFIQNISTREYLATLVGKPLPPYKGYNKTVDPGIDHFFGGVALRYGNGRVRGRGRRRGREGEGEGEGNGEGGEKKGAGVE